MAHAHVYIFLAIFFSFFMALGIGANDVANAMGTSVGSRAITIFQAVIVAAIFETMGALFFGGQVTDTIRSKLIDVNVLSHSPELLIYGMMASLLSSGTWLIVATRFGWPVSTTHGIIGSVVGFGMVVLGVAYIQWTEIFSIFFSWMITPVIAGIIAFLMFKSVQNFIFASNTPVSNARKCVPLYVFGTSFILTIVTFANGSVNAMFHFRVYNVFAISLLISLFISIGSFLYLKKKFSKLPVSKDGPNRNIVILEKMFSVLLVITACAMAFAHGSNDVANAIGPLAAIMGIVNSGGSIMAKAPVPFVVLSVGAVGIVLGLILYGHKVIATIGSSITELTPSRGFTAQLACAATVVFSSYLGIPVSTSQTLVGAILGVGCARGIGALNLAVIRNIFFSWIVTLPAGAFLAIMYFYIILYFSKFFLR